MERVLKTKIKEAVRILYDSDASDDLIQIQETRKDFVGDFTLVVFPLLRFSKNTPEKTGEMIGKHLIESFPAVSGYNVIKGFLNLEISDAWWISNFSKMLQEENLMAKCVVDQPETILVEYSSPNTNKPLHLGHIRNSLLGFSLYRILTVCGHKVIKTNIVNDRGIHICKSMLAWQKFGNGETPESSGIKGDHLVGKYYVLFEKQYREEAEDLIAGGMEPVEAKNNAPLLKEAREMLLKWEAGDPEIINLWNQMNSWVYSGFDETYKKLGVDFDKIYYESDTYKLGRDLVFKALKEGLLYKNGDSSIWIDLKTEGLDQKLLLRSDGTAVYMTQDLGTAVLRHEEFGFDRCIYVVGNEQNYHFQVLKAVLKKMDYSWSDGLFHFSYGMVELPEGKMKSREGVVVDADDLIAEMAETAKDVSLELGKLAEYRGDEKEEIFRKIGLGALKYFILKVDPKKNMTFNPSESIDFNGNTGPFIQYTYARIRSVFRKADEMNVIFNRNFIKTEKAGSKEIQLIRLLRRFTATVTEAAESYSPSLIANYCYELAKEYNQFYHDFTILGEKDPSVRDLRMAISELTARILGSGMFLLGIEMPERM
ncbi:MAG TPA: arginine--tRNA ligase [Bacteroidales bacterium]|nr:arginine--tRNA ligase [Bacteroidales bacterium]